MVSKSRSGQKGTPFVGKFIKVMPTAIASSKDARKLFKDRPWPDFFKGQILQFPSNLRHHDDGLHKFVSFRHGAGYVCPIEDMDSDYDPEGPYTYEIYNQKI